jgi:hypothetical protein
MKIVGISFLLVMKKIVIFNFDSRFKVTVFTENFHPKLFYSGESFSEPLPKSWWLEKIHQSD